MSNLFPLFIALLAIALIFMTVRAIRAEARHRDAERRAAQAERAAASTWGDAYQAGAGEQYLKLEREIKGSYDKGFESGWNTCVTQFEERPEYRDTAAA